MLYAAVRQSPFFGGKVSSFDKKTAMSHKGVKAVITSNNGIAVVADSTWNALQGIQSLDVQFEGGKKHTLGTKSLDALFSSNLEKMGKGQIQGEKTLDLEYEIQFLSHAALEPINCTAFVTEHSCEVWGPFQFQSRALNKIEDMTGLSENKIKVHTT